MASPFTMIGVVRKDGGGAEQLLGEHRPGEEVRPGRLAEGEQEIGAAALLVAEAVGAADQETRLAPAAVAPGLQLLRECEGRELLAFSSRRTVTLPSAGGGALPPDSGSSVILVGHAIRFR
jgi:hypothetical protein